MSTNKSSYVSYPQLGKKYRHYKGGLYEVISMATHSETGESLVIYKSLLFGSIYARPVSMWFEWIDDNGTSTTRFKLED